MKKLLALIATLSLLGCGGGGGGGDGGSDNDFSVSTTTRSLSFSYYAGEQIFAQTIVVTGNGTPSSDVYVGGGWNGDGLSTVEYDIVGSAASFYVTPEANLEPGTYTGTIVLLACKDEVCTSHHKGSPIKIPYSINVSPGIQTSPASLELTGVLGTTLHGEFDVTLPPGGTLNSVWAYQTIRNLTQNGNHISFDIPTDSYNISMVGEYEDSIDLYAQVNGRVLVKHYNVKYTVTQAPALNVSSQGNAPAAKVQADNAQAEPQQHRTAIKKWITAGSNPQ
ncbi:hypothetical protein [Chitiniphilus shinanonensis]|uniref:hypothetical protein n=1 Tax=Chitiniphilus shinanonensis TaxID=553088 RepID=UPI00304B3E70